MADQYIFETAVSDGAPEHTPFVKKDWIYIPDNNGGSYSGNIQFDTAVACDSGKWVNWQEAYLMIPFTIISKSTGDISSDANAYMCGLRNGSHHLVNSCSISYNGTTVVQQTNLLNHFVSYKLMTTYSQDDLVKNGPSTQFWPDTASSFRYSSTGALKDGDGVTNNRLYGAVNGSNLGVNGSSPDQTNFGAYQRSKQVLDFSDKAVATNQNGLISSTAPGTQLLTVDNAKTLGRAIFTDSGDAAAAKVYYWEILCKIPLRHLCDFFAQMAPLVKGALLQINIGYKASSQTVNVASGGPVTLASAVTMTGLTNPLLIACGASNQPNALAFTDTSGCTQTFACGINKATDSNGVTKASNNSLMSQCRIYLPTYVLAPNAEEMLLKLHPTRTIQYQDLYQYTISGTIAGGSFSQLLSSSIVNPKSIVIMPYIAKTSLPGNHASNPVYCSPFTTEGATTSPLLGISNLAIQVSGTNVWNANQTYDFEAFNNELQSINAINGNKMWGITSGLISETDYYFGYRCYVCDLQKRLPSEDLVPKSITISGTNTSNVTVDYVVFISYGRQCQIETLTGALLQ